MGAVDSPQWTQSITSSQHGWHVQRTRNRHTSPWTLEEASKDSEACTENHSQACQLGLVGFKLHVVVTTARFRWPLGTALIIITLILYIDELHVHLCTRVLQSSLILILKTMYHFKVLGVTGTDLSGYLLASLFPCTVVVSMYGHVIGHVHDLRK